MAAPTAAELDGKWHADGQNGWQIDATVETEK
jgi:hypothetical protein